jgi:hypothetical protein
MILEITTASVLEEQEQIMEMGLSKGECERIHNRRNLNSEGFEHFDFDDVVH